MDVKSNNSQPTIIGQQAGQWETCGRGNGYKVGSTRWRRAAMVDGDGEQYFLRGER
jgi:hypothetical protein